MSYIAIVLILGLLVLVHEAGHVLVAKAVGIGVRRFAVGFGPRLWSRTWRGTEYAVCAIPLGGYVLPSVRSEAEYLRIPLLRRVGFSLGGPAANILLALGAFALLNTARGHASAHALLVAPFAQLADGAWQILCAVGGLFSGSDAVAGVVGIVATGSSFAGLDPVRLLLFATIVDLNLAVLNLLPLPPLDGGKIVLDALERLLPATRRAYVPVVLSGWLVLLGLMVYATAMDVSRIAA
jgi:regulator of sigma E protease